MVVEVVYFSVAVRQQPGIAVSSYLGDSMSAGRMYTLSCPGCYW